MSKYKVGDKVRIINTMYRGSNFQIGCTGTVTEQRGSLCRVEADDKGKDNILSFYDWELELAKENNMQESKYKVGQTLVNTYEDYSKKVIAIVNDEEVPVVVTKDSDDDTYNAYAEGNIEDNGWKLETETTEVTLEQIAKKFNVSVEKLRIKD